MKASEAKFGEWYKWNGIIFKCVYECSLFGEALFVNRRGDASRLGTDSITHLPDCDSFDWEPPKAPDPGEGFREIDTENEEPQKGDQLWCNSSQVWAFRLAPLMSFAKDTIYRRRIEPTYEQFTQETFKPYLGLVFTRIMDSSQNCIATGSNEHCVLLGLRWYTWKELFDTFTFDGHPAGTEVKTCFSHSHLA